MRPEFQRQPEAEAPAKSEFAPRDVNRPVRAGATLAPSQNPLSPSDWDLPITAHAPRYENGATVTPSTPSPPTTEEQQRRSSFEPSAVPPVVEGPLGKIEAEIEKIEGATFSVTLRGYDRQEVEAFLCRAVARDYRRVIKSARDAVSAARAVATAPAPPPPPPSPAPAPPSTAPTFEDVGGRAPPSSTARRGRR